jgi:alpha-L-arabinofuranosidase
MAALVFSCAQAFAQTGTGHITVHVDRPGPKISPMFYGMMTEEINHAYDGGLYAELIRNRVFKDEPNQPVAWSVEGPGTIDLDDANPVPGTALTRSLKVTATGASNASRVAVVNEGFWGVPLRPNTTYAASFYAKAAPSFSGSLFVSLEGQDSVARAKSSAVGLTGDWKQYKLTLKTGRIVPESNGRFKIWTNSPGAFWLTQVSLFPPTFHRQPNGDRSDLIDLLAGLNPSFLRLPGGNYLEGDTIAERFNWKATLGDISQRPGHRCPWGYESSDGFGLLEFLEWCDDLHIQPLVAVYAGYSLRGEHVNPGPDLAPYVQDALDEIEFVTGSTKTKWGAMRAKLGHPRPWKLTYVEIGNEDEFDRSRSYDGRFAQFFDAIKKSYPKLQLIATAHVTSRLPDVIDDHYYRTAAAMARDSGHYDSYDRKGPKIFVGEWASTEGRPTPTHKAALGDAAWLTGLERNSDLVVMESYAPLFVNVNPGASQWPTNLVGYDNLNSFGSPSYYVQSMFGKNTGDTVIPTEVEAKAAIKIEPPAHGAVGLGTWITDAEYKDILVENDGLKYEKDFSATGMEGWKFPRGAWKLDDGAIRQTSLEEDTAAIGGDPSWTDYTLHVKAKKLGGSEGFLIRFHVRDAENYWQWNIGGWGDTRSSLQRVSAGEAQEMGRSARVTVETGKWYDIRIHVVDGRIECYLDDKLITRANETSEPFSQPVYVAASRVSSSGEIILKVVNVSDSSVDLHIDLPGAGSLDPVAKGWQLSGQPQDQNSLANPTKVAPKSISVTGVSAAFNRTFPPYSVTVLRLKENRGS